MDFFEAISAEHYDREYSDLELVRRILKYFYPQKNRLILIGIMVLVMSVVGAILPLVAAWGVGLLVSIPSSSTIVLITGLVLGAGILNWVANLLRRRMTVASISDVMMALSTDAFKASMGHDLSFFDKFSSGKVVSRITSDTREFGQLIVLLTDLFSQVIESGILCVILIEIEWRLSLYLFAIIPVVVVMAISFRQMARKVTQQGMRAMANVNSTIKETISGIKIAKNFRQETSIYNDFMYANSLSYQVNVKRGLVLSLIFPSLNAVGGVATAVLVYVGGLSVMQGIVSIGAWYLFLLSIDRFMFPVMNVSSFWTQVQSGLSASERIFALIDTEQAVVQTADLPVSKIQGKIDFENVDFYYNENEPVLENFTLHIHAGENLAFVGHTGAGKTSVAKLISRFYEFQKGKILIDDQDIRSLNLIDYRRHLGIVSQSPFLFSGTIADNIRYTCPTIAEREIKNIANQIGNGEWLETLPLGLQTEVGERGSLLSMGQRQLVALMRVLVQKPAIFILDEATASVDPFTEYQIQQGLNLILKESTSIMIAHRLSTVKSADRIIVISDGKIVQQGNHEGLLTAGGEYATLYNTYFRHQSLEYIEKVREFIEPEL
jgi:ATP-binding cassette, subfamily B, bacterial